MNPDDLRKAALLEAYLRLTDTLLRAVEKIKFPEEVSIVLNFPSNIELRGLQLPLTLKLNLIKILNDCRSEILRKASEL